MKSTISKKTKKIAYLLAVVYFTSYCMRVNLAVMLVKICSEMQVEKSALAIVITGLTVAYGTGQIISGFLGDRFKPQHIIPAGLFLAVVCNVGIFFASTIPAMTVIWSVNGFAHALLWPPIVRLMSTHLSAEDYSFAAVRVNQGSSIATIALYLFCPLLLGFMEWRTIMLLCAAWGTVMIVLWFILYPRVFTKTEMNKDKAESPAPVAEQKALPIPFYIFGAISLIMPGIMLQGMLRDGVTNWMPSFLLETFGLSEENSIVSTVILAIFTMISYSAFGALQKKFFRNEVKCASAIFGGSAIVCALLFLVNVFAPATALVPSLLLMALTVAAMHGVNLMLIAIVPRRFVPFGKVSTYSGILNACTYVGAAISTYGFAALAETFDWNFTILTWVAISSVGAVVCFFGARIWRKHLDAHKF
ncbi:MAG: MFS transporter [Ruminococcaceae bacterium]|nr:MFS transporter [Oscillospiraceae bacterium]